MYSIEYVTSMDLGITIIIQYTGLWLESQIICRENDVAQAITKKKYKQLHIFISEGTHI